MAQHRSDTQIVNAKTGTTLGGGMPGGTRDSRKHLNSGDEPDVEKDDLEEALLRELVVEVLRLL